MNTQVSAHLINCYSFDEYNRLLYLWYVFQFESSEGRESGNSRDESKGIRCNVWENSSWENERKDQKCKDYERDGGKILIEDEEYKKII